ncbi:hypothetical protein NKH48_19240 [Mesorhizobium sp. M1233]|uniref:hypothetical protein n=1 Tax=Mesorhizobium sp. M1233 TaxID=2957072 RepID=UPI003334AA08
MVEKPAQPIECLLGARVEHPAARSYRANAPLVRFGKQPRGARRLPREEELWRFRVLGAIVPDIDDVVATERKNLPTPASPILPLHLRPALLAGVAIVEHAGPEMLRMLRGHTMGDNRTRFGDLVDKMTAQTCPPQASSQMQLI